MLCLKINRKAHHWVVRGEGYCELYDLLPSICLHRCPVFLQYLSGRLQCHACTSYWALPYVALVLKLWLLLCNMFEDFSFLTLSRDMSCKHGGESKV